MWRYDKSMTIMVVLLSLSLLAIQTVPCLAEARDLPKKPRVAFVGIYFEKTPESVQKQFRERIETLLRSENNLTILSREEIAEKLDSEQIQQALQSGKSEDYRLLAEKLDADHVYGGNLANQSRDDTRVLLVGELIRYDRDQGLLNRFELAKYYGQIGPELRTFKKEYIQTIVPKIQEKKTLWPWLVLAGVMLAGLIAMSLTITKFGAEGNPGDVETPEVP